MSSSKKIYYPIMLEISEKKILIIGAGPAAAEKLRSLEQICRRSEVKEVCKKTRKVRVIAKEFSEAFLHKDWLELVHKPYESGDMKGFHLVYVGINDPAIEEKILHDAHGQNVLINFIDKVEDSDFISPSVLLRENYSIFISTYGKGPGMTKKIRKAIEDKIDLEKLDIEAGEYIKGRKLKS